ncbi:MAG: ATP-binding protein [Verrucomicrobia bacterium]|nr:ATP-binding protein [Verrucomicrobiota bacterium]
MKNNDKKSGNQLNISADLQRQRDFIAELQAKKFEYGLVLANAFVKGMRDIGYKSTAFALDELIDNAVQAGARNVHVAFGYATGNASEKKPEMLAVIDDGHGMDPMMIRAAVIWGGTHRQNDRTGFGRYGYGLPSACVSIGRRYTVLSKVEGGEWHSVHIDLDEIEGHFQKGQGPFYANEPRPAELPKWVATYITKHLSSLKAGTVVLIEKIDRLDYKTTRSLSDFLLQEFGVTYRNFMSEVALAVNGIEVEPTDPLFLTPGARFYDIDEERATALPPLAVEVKDRISGEVAGIVKVRYSQIPSTFLRTPEDKLKFKGGKPNSRFPVRRANNGIIVLRAGRQIDVVNALCPWTKFQTNDNYVGVEVDFPPTLDEEFSITTSKQQIRLSDRLWDILEQAGVFDAISTMRAAYEKESAVIRDKWEEEQRKTKQNEKRPSEAAIEKAQRFFTQPPNEPTPKQVEKSQENLDREASKLAEQTNIPKEEAKKILEGRAKTAPFKVLFEDMPGAPFYRMAQVGGQKVLYLNRDHRFYSDLYASTHATPHVRYALEALLFVMGTAEIRAKEDRQLFYEQERQLWSTNLNTTLKALEEWDAESDDLSAEAEASHAAALKAERDGKKTTATA